MLNCFLEREVFLFETIKFVIMNFRRHGKIWVIGLFLSLMPYACYDELDLPPSLKEGGGRELFSVGEARRYFETHAKDLALPYFSAQKPETKSVEGETPELVPEWSKALQDSNRLVSLVQVPIRSNAKVTAIVRNYENGRQVAEKYAHSEMRLVVARQPDSVTVMFVATLIPSLQHCPNPAESMKNFSFLGGGDFTGQAFCFTLDGRFVEAWEYVNGKRIGPYEVATIKQFMRNNISLENKNYESVSLGHSMPTRLGAYSLDECSAEAGCVCEEHENCLCPYCLDEAIARVCPYCRASLEPGEVCDCKSKCVWCGYNPCRCCSVCLKYPCKCNFDYCGFCGMSPCQCLSDCLECRPGICTACKTCGRHYCWGNHGGASTGDGETDPNNPVGEDTMTEINKTNIVDKIFTDTFKSKIVNDLGVNPDHITINVNSNLPHAPYVRAIYNDVDNSICIFDAMFSNNLTQTDMESILYHEYVHAKQYLKDNVVIERDGINIKTSEYVLIVSEFDVMLANLDLEFMCEQQGIPLESDKRNELQERDYQYLKGIYLDPELERYHNKDTYTVYLNKELVKCEYEAYRRQYENYKDVMSEYLKLDTKIGLERNKNYYEQIKDK